MKYKSKRITGWLLDIFYDEGLDVDIIELAGGSWFHADELFKRLNGNRLGHTFSDDHKMYPLEKHEYIVVDIERRPTVYVNGMGALKMLHNVLSPYTAAIFKKVGLNHIQQIIEQGTLNPVM